MGVDPSHSIRQASNGSTRVARRAESKVATASSRVPCRGAQQSAPATRKHRRRVQSRFAAWPGRYGRSVPRRNPRLNRDVALKVLPESLRWTRHASPGSNARRSCSRHSIIQGLRQFTASSIRTQTPVLVLELVEGATLADRLAAGPLALDDVLRVAQQLAIALEAAHEKGVVHRDLKPANIKVTDRGQVKVLDFGVAKMLAPEGDSTPLANSPTVSLRATQAGEILGTAAYMSPEQARGRALDRRTDVWSFGCVLFEMLTGAAPFSGATVSDIIAAILKSRTGVEGVTRRHAAADRAPAETLSRERSGAAAA